MNERNTSVMDYLLLGLVWRLEGDLYRLSVGIPGGELVARLHLAVGRQQWLQVLEAHVRW